MRYSTRMFVSGRKLYAMYGVTLAYGAAGEVFVYGSPEVGFFAIYEGPYGHCHTKLYRSKSKAVAALKKVKLWKPGRLLVEAAAATVGE